jgi:hypothetical protein
MMSDIQKSLSPKLVCSKQVGMSLPWQSLGTNNGRDSTLNVRRTEAICGGWEGP